MIGRMLQVRFVPNRADVRGTNQHFTKIAFIARRYAGTRPRQNEEWMCRVVGDSKPEEPNRGALFLMPLWKLQPETRWGVVPTEAGPTSPLQIVRREVLGERELEAQRWSVASEAEIDAGWPVGLQERVLATLKDRARELKAARKQCERQRQQALIPQLKNPVSIITITAVSSFEHRVTARATDDRYDNYKIFVDRKRVGLYDRGAGLPLPQFPLTIHGRRLTLSNGKSFDIHSHELPVVKAWKRSEGRWTPKKASIFRTRCEIAELDRKELSWAEVQDLSQGDVLAHEYPFQWVDGWLTNGAIWFPRERPQGSDWQEYPIPAVPEGCWSVFLSGLEGKFLCELIPFHKQVTTRKARVRLTERQEKLRAVIAGQMWQGSDGCKQVSVGKNVVFHVNRGAHPPLFLVDNPGIGAIYLFPSLDAAMKFARGEVTRSEAIKLGYQRVIHCRQWQLKVTELLIA